MQEYYEAIISFSDILGFKKLVSSKPCADVLDALNKLKHFSEPDTERENKYDQQYVNFSDTIIRARRIDTIDNIEYPTGLLFHEINDLLLIQIEMMNYGIFMRGGLTIGKIYYDEYMIFGPGFIDAYEIESNIATVPRIAISATALNKLVKEKDNRLVGRQHDLAEEKKSIRGLLRLDSDGIWFIDYLKGIFTELDDPEMCPKILLKHKKMICNLFKNEGGSKSIQHKIAWLATYHNRTINNSGRADIQKKDYIISTTEVPTIVSFKEID